MKKSLLKMIMDRLEEAKKIKYYECFQAHQKDDKGYCYGLAGGTASTDFLNEVCIDCPYLMILLRGDIDE